ncbi:U-box domain-containing protein 21-like [Andrographis paniculata]|uniref:U-box domain-containing protein 21-like n=1 Tax=Andrographis paniculata TaxID=175694 RepID=UPI0021E77321|nr:U-box domain-containing protein 21-like [Andrographis paniculata]
MPFLWRRKRGSGRRGAPAKREVPKAIVKPRNELVIPTHFRCPISLDLMKDPVSLSTGITYDRESIENWIDAGHVTCPVTNQVLRNIDRIPNHSLRQMIQDWCVENKSLGVERIPTPRIPISSFDASEIFTRILASARERDEATCSELLGKIKNLAKENERNKRCMVGNGIGSTLANVFDSFARVSGDTNINLLEEILATLTWSFPLGQDGVSKLKSPASLHFMARILNHESNSQYSTIQNTIIMLKELIFEDRSVVERIMEVEGIERTFLRVLEMPVGPKATQACLMIIHQIMTTSKQEKENHTSATFANFIRLGLVPLILDILVDSNRSTCEKALIVLDNACDSEEGKKTASANALTIPLIVKKILRVSDTATEYSIAILSKLSFGENEDALADAVTHGAFQKLLVVLQVGCGERTKENASELLRLMNKYRNKLDCFDSSMGFKYMKKSN